MFLKNAVGKMSKVQLLSLVALSLSVSYPVLASNAENDPRQNRAQQNLMDQIGKANQSISYLQEQNKTLIKQFKAKQSQYATEYQGRKNAEQTLSQLEEQIVGLNESLTLSAARFDQKNLEMTALVAAFEEQRLQKIEAEATILALGEELQTTRGRVDELTQALEQLRAASEQANQQLAHANAALQDNLDEVRQTINAAEQRNRSLAVQKEELESDLRDAESDLLMLEERIQSEQARHEQELAAKILELRQEAEERLTQAVLQAKASPKAQPRRKATGQVRNDAEDKENGSYVVSNPLTDPIVKAKVEADVLIKPASGSFIKPLLVGNDGHVGYFLGLSGGAVYYAMFAHGHDYAGIFSLYEFMNKTKMPELELVSVSEQIPLKDQTNCSASQSHTKPGETILDNPVDYALNNGFNGIIKMMDSL